MSLLLESIKLLDGQFHNLFHHEQRMNRSLKMLCGVSEEFDLEKFLDQMDRPAEGLFKCRLTYDDVSRDVEFIHYEMQEVKTLRAVESDRISYAYKYTDRKAISKLFEQKKTCDDILIMRRGLVTDSSYANIAFRKGKHWYTPWSPLLKGTMRAFLLENNIIEQDEIRSDDISTFEGFKLINAMIGFDSPEQPITNIIF